MWIITKDLIDCGTQEGRKSSEKTTLEKIKSKPNHCKFRLLDDDDEVYYEGWMSNSSSFAPLDDFGMPNDGCTALQCWENGKWCWLQEARMTEKLRDEEYSYNKYGRKRSYHNTSFKEHIEDNIKNLNNGIISGKGFAY